MSSVGLIMRADRSASELPADWTPGVLGTRASVLAIVDRVIREAPPGVALTLNIEDEQESPEPRTIGVSGVLGAAELTVIRSLCDELSARFYDAEQGDFVEE